MTRVIYRSDFSAVDFTDHVAAHHFASFVSALVQKSAVVQRILIRHSMGIYSSSEKQFADLQ
jgi:hypothetical protein